MRKKIFFTIKLMLVVLIVGSFTLYHNPPATQKTLLVFPKGSDYEKEWAKVDSLQKKGLTRSALDVVDGVLKKAKEDNNSPQIVKALIHKIKLESYIEEDSYVKAIYDLQKEADSSLYPLKPVLHSIVADIYWRYYQNNRWKFYNRTETVNFISGDIRTWDLKRLVAEVIKNYELSLQNEDSLKRTPISAFDDVLIKEKDSREFRPTLYDFLAHRAADFYMNEEPNITRPAYKFELDKEEYFRNAQYFVRLQISTKDTISLKFRAITLLQGLLAFHLDDTEPAALIDVDIKRLRFVKQNSIVESKDSLFLLALENLQKAYAGHEGSAEAAYEIARHHNEWGDKHAPLQSGDYKWEKKKAVEICNLTIKKFPESYGAYDCKNLLARINEKSLSFTAEQVNLPGKPFLSLLKYKNIDKVYFRIAALDFHKYRRTAGNKYGEGLMDFYKSLKPLKEWTVWLINDGDYQQHAVELKIPELASGHYIILAGTDEKFSYGHNAIAYSPCWISNISYLTREMNDGSYDVYVFHRETGEPLKGVSAQLYYEKYNYTLREYEWKETDRYVTDDQGHFIVQFSSEYRSFFIDFTLGEDRLNTNYSYYQYKRYPETKKRIVTHFFTDRSIYRPGQTIYFKGIIIETDGENNAIKPGFTTTVQLYDVNYQKASELKLSSNQYGSISGTFTAPASGLAGQMHIADNHGSVYFSVEEYKRPKFEVTFDTIKGSYKLGEKVNVKGIAKAYAGSNIDDARVQYRVARIATFPYWWYWWRGYYPSSPEMEITNCVTKTNEKGEFEIQFTAIPDKSIPKDYHPTYTFTVYADVTDIGGETHSGTQYVNVGYKALVIDIDIPGELNKNGKKEYTLKTTNLMGEKEPAQGNVAIYKLKEPDRNFRKRVWDRPDKFIMTKEEFRKHFPKDVFDDEDNMYKWEKEAKVYSQPFDTEKSTELMLDKSTGWKQGYYVLEALTKDKFGEEVKEMKYFTLFSDTGKEMPAKDISRFTSLKIECEPGDKAAILVGSAEQNIKLLYEIESKEKVVHKEWINLSNEQKKIEISIEEKHRGNIAVHFAFVKDNRAYNYSQVITVPYTNKKLDIEFETFRNKLTPGQKEEWRIKIKGPKGEKAAAEMIAAMYDASLDAFRYHNWYFDIYRSYYSNFYWQSTQAFNIINSRLFHIDWNTYPGHISKYYDRLNWFGFEHYGYYGDRHYYKSARRADDAMPPDEETGMEAETMAAPESKDRDKTGVGDVAQTMAAGAGEIAGLPDKPADKTRELAMIKARSDFSETAFFYPHLETDEKGEVIVKFTIPEALTRWKFMSLSHTKDLEFGQLIEEVVTQKELMAMPNAPRFFREGDKMTFTTKISNLADKDLAGDARLMFFDAISMNPVDEKFLIEKNSIRPFKVKKGLSAVVKWDIQIPDDIQAVTYRVVAKADKFTDGEEMALPVLTNRMMVTESLPLPVKGNQSKTFKFEKLLNSQKSSTLKHHKITLEYTSNPAWYAIQALPYLMEFPYECSEQIFGRFYANSIASHIANSNPKIKRVFETWKSQSPEAFLSNLEKNQELKSLMLEETPWVLDAKDETERKKRVGILFDLNRMSNELGQALKKLEKAQVSNGGWTWFPGMPDSRYITQHIVTGFGHLDKLGVREIRENKSVWNMMLKAVPYLDDRIREDYEYLLKHDYNLEKNNLGSTQIQYLYARSYFNDIPVANRNKKSFDYYFGQAKKFWMENNRYLQGMIALALHRYEEKVLPMGIVKSLKENAIFSEEMGMYWKDIGYGYYWYQAPIESQALLIETFSEVADDRGSVEEMKVWLLKQKQTQDWKTTKATTEACYALLLRGTDWLASDEPVKISLGDMEVDPGKMDDVKVEAGTGYFKTSWSKGEIKPEWGNVKVTKTDDGVSWGALYWQYFEQLDKITPHETPLKLNKKLFLEEQSDYGPVITPVNNKTQLKPGDKIKVRIELRVDRNMEYVHMKDMRAAGFEPINVLSQYKYQDGLGYYESTKDAATNFFFDRLPKGAYVFEYPLRVTHKGDFSNGITTIQCMYAPEFTSHSEGIRIVVGE